MGTSISWSISTENPYRHGATKVELTLLCRLETPNNTRLLGAQTMVTGREPVHILPLLFPFLPILTSSLRPKQCQPEQFTPLTMCILRTVRFAFPRYNGSSKKILTFLSFRCSNYGNRRFHQDQHRSWGRGRRA